MKVKSSNNKFYIKSLLGVFLLLALLIFFSVDLTPKEQIINNSSYKPIPDSIKTFFAKPSSLPEVLSFFKNEQLFLSVKDEASTNLPDSVKNFVKKLGGSELSRLGFRQSYAGVIQSGKFVKEKRNSKQSVVLNFNNEIIKSAANQHGNHSQLILNGNQYIGIERGLHVWVQPQMSNKVFHYVFDFFEKANPISKGNLSQLLNDDLEQIELILSPKAYNKIEQKRAEALKTNLLLTSDDDLVQGKVLYNGQYYKVKTRLKGDWTDHLYGDKWSFRIKLDEEETIMGMKKFSLHHPRTRNYAGEWLFHQLLKEKDILHLQYKFVQFWLTVPGENGSKRKDLGIYALEESFEKQLFERQKRRAGLILKLDESVMWEERADFMANGINGRDLIYINFTDFDKFNIVPFGQKQIMQDPVLKKQFIVARQLLLAYIKGEKSATEVFDVEKLVNYNAICNLLGSYHAMVPHNWRLYYNPITARLEPIGFDANGMEKAYQLHYFYWAKNDFEYLKQYNQKIEELVNSKTYQQLIDYPGLRTQLAILRREFSNVNWEEKSLKHNHLLMKSTVLPRRSINVFLEELDDEKMELSVENFGRMFVEILDLQHKNNRSFGDFPNEVIIPPGEKRKITISLDKNYQKLFVNKKKKKSNFDIITDIERIKLIWKTPGTTITRSAEIHPWRAEDEAIKASFYEQRAPKELPDFPFLDIDTLQKRITFKQGRWELRKTLKIPQGFTLYIYPGSHLEFIGEYGQIISYAPVKFIGSENNPISFISDTEKGGGIFILSDQDTSIIQHCIFDNLGTPKTQNWSLSGAVNFYESPVKISHSIFKNNRSEDALNIINSWFEMDYVAFSDTQSDAFDGDFVEGTISNSTFHNLGNDAIDISGSNLIINKVVIMNAGDKGLSAGENSQMTVEGALVQNSEVAIACKDLSTITINQSVLKANALGFTAFQKKPEFGPCQIEATNIKVENNKLDYLIEVNSSLQLNGQLMPVSEGVKERMYGAEFGKSSK